MCKISVIVPVYNVEKSVEKCIESVLNQTYMDIEVVIVNDGTPDNSQKIIDKYQKKYSNIKSYIKENGGLSSARNYGVKQATSEYITFVDSDDYLEENIYKNLQSYMEEKLDLIKFKMSTVDENDKIIEKLDGPIFEKCSGEEAFKKLYTTDTFLDVSCIYLYRKEFYIKNNFQFELNAYHEDFGLIPWILINAKSVASAKEFGYYYLKRQNSITDMTNLEKEKKKAYDILKHYDNAIQRVEQSNLSNKAITMFKKYYTNVLLLKVNILKGKEQREFIKCIKTRKVYKNIKAENLKQLVKKILVMINIKLYLKIR